MHYGGTTDYMDDEEIQQGIMVNPSGRRPIGIIIHQTAVDETMDKLLKAQEDDRMIIEKVQKNDIMRADNHKFNIGQVLDIRVSKGGIPNRVMVLGYFVTTDTIKPHLMYKILLESNRQVSDVSAEWLEAVLTHKYKKNAAPVYKMPVIELRYNEGWRWLGNYEHTMARQDAYKLKKNALVAQVRMCEAYNRMGKLDPNTVSVWFKYKNPIQEDATGIVNGDGTFTIDI